MKCPPALTSRTAKADRSGVTLLELILVMAIIAFFGALVLPGFDRIFAAQRIDKSAEIVRAEMGRARVQAIRTGKVFAFVYNEGRSELAVRQFDQLVQAGTVEHFQRAGGGGDGQSPGADVRNGNMDYSNERLPRGVRFVGLQTFAVNSKPTPRVVERASSSRFCFTPTARARTPKSSWPTSGVMRSASWSVA
ncbi:MAG: prepilin-type N-terminal cleavage/methylation domain-containing protein [Blastopirellula sp.]|nr:prepilin-type N-terminal cleavage/methylation domain-containing protein [Blastopirellula sp.]